MEDNRENVKIAMSSSFKRGRDISPRTETHLRTLLDRDVQEERQELALLEIDLSKEKEYGELIGAAKESIVEIYKEAGVDLEESNFPRVFLVREEEREKIPGLEDDNSSFFFQRGFAAVVTVGVDDHMLGIAETIHHELEHGVGRQVIVAKGKGSKWLFKKGQVGLGTLGRDQDSDRGKVMEEMVVTVNARNFALGSDNPTIAKIRADFIEDNKVKMEDLQKEEEFFLIRYFACSYLLDMKSTLEYSAAGLIAARLRSGLFLKEGREGLDFWNDMLVARVEPDKKRSLIKRIDNAFGRGTGSRLFKLKFEFEKMRDFADSLKIQGEV